MRWILTGNQFSVYVMFIKEHQPLNNDIPIPHPSKTHEASHENLLFLPADLQQIQIKSCQPMSHQWSHKPTGKLKNQHSASLLGFQAKIPLGLTKIFPPLHHTEGGQLPTLISNQSSPSHFANKKVGMIFPEFILPEVNNTKILASRILDTSKGLGYNYCTTE